MSTWAVPYWPIAQLEPERPKWEIARGIVTGGSNLSDWTQTGIFGGGGIWKVQMARIVITDDLNQRMTWRATQALLDGGAAPIIVAWPDYAGFEEVFPEDEQPFVPFGGGSTFSDGGEFESYGALVTTVDAALQSATTMTLDVVSGPALQGGMIFSVLDAQGLPRRHQIQAAWAIEGEAGQYGVRFRPWLRDNVPAGAEVNFSCPGCVMKLSDPKSIFADEMAGRFAEVSPVLDEWFGTLP
jgi:hypothetical protein